MVDRRDHVTLAWFHCFSGVAGDMVLGALIDAGADVDDVRAMVARLPVRGWELDAEVVLRAGLRATRAIVHAPEDPGHRRTLADLRNLVAGAGLPERVRARALASFTALADVEGRLHGVPADEVHFHEVGALDAIVDVVGACAALELLEVDEVHTSPVAVGLGTVRSAHGELPNPAPASLALLASAGIAVVGVSTPVELSTPTGAALLAGLGARCGATPAMTPTVIGYGAGGRELENRANVVQAVIGPAAPAEAQAGLGEPGQPMVELAANVDDVTGEVLAHTVAALLAAGANDAWVTPILMKKGRPAHTIHALCDPVLAGAVGRVLLAESGTLGLRGTRLERWPQAREELTVDLDGHVVRVKRSGQRIKVEHDDAARAAEALGRPLREVIADVERRAATAAAADAGSPREL